MRKIFFCLILACVVALIARAQLTTFPQSGGGSGATTVAGLSDAGTAAYSNATAFALASAPLASLSTNNAASLTNYAASNIVSGGQIPVGTLATNTASASANELLQVTGNSRAWQSNVWVGGGMRVSAGFTNDGLASFPFGLSVSNTGIYFPNNGSATDASVRGNNANQSDLTFKLAGADTFRFLSSILRMDSGVVFGWSSGSPSVAGSDTTMQRSAAGTILFTSSGIFKGTVTATNAFVMPTNYVAANFTPVAGCVSIVASNGVLYKVTQLSTNLLSSNTP